MECAPSNIISPTSVLLEEEEDIRVLKKTNKELAQTNLTLQSLLKTSQSRITELEARLGLNSANSNFPSSRNVVPLPPKSTNRCKKSGKKAGGQPGRKGVTRKRSDTPNKVLSLSLDTCPCGCSLLKIPPIKKICHQVYDIPIQPFEITEYRSDVKICPNCSRKISAPFPAEAKNNINFGPNIKAFALYQHVVNFTPYDRLVKMIQDFFGQRLSPATIAKFISTASKSLDEYDNEVRAALLKSLILHADETGFRVKGERWWLHSLSNDRFTYYGVHLKRGSEAMDHIGLLNSFFGVLVHDFWSSYAKYPALHAYCNAHLIRELQGIYDGFKQEWAIKMRELLEEMYQYVFGREVHDEHEIQELIERYDKLIMEGERANPPPLKEEGKKGSTKNTKGGNLVKRMKNHKDGVLLFLTTRGEIPFTNNEAEQAVRMMKVQQKISGTFRTEDGAKHFAALRGYISTMKKQGISAYEAVQALAIGQPILLSSLSA
jgi:transposase